MQSLITMLMNALKRTLSLLITKPYGAVLVTFILVGILILYWLGIIPNVLFLTTETNSTLEVF